MKKTLVADDFLKDPEVQDAKETLIRKLKEHQSKIKEMLMPEKDLEKSYSETLEGFSQARGMSLFFPYLGSGIGNGPFVELGDGSVKYDFINGIGVHYFGHSSAELISHVIDSALSDTFMQGNLQQTVTSFDFCKKLIDLANKNKHCIDHCFLTTSGAMANENALKLAFHKNHPADRVIAFENCFAGRTLALSNVTDKAHYRVGLPDTLKVDYVPFYDYKNPEESIKVATAALKKHIKRHPGKHAAMVFELVQGEGGSWTASTEFHLALMKICREHKIAVIVDEVQTFARTSQVFAFQHYKLDDWVDMITVGKTSQVCATLFTSKYKPGPGLISQTFTSSSTAIAAGSAILDQLSQNNYFGSGGKIESLYKHFEAHLEKLSKSYPEKVKGPFGIGAMVAFTPFQGDATKTTELVKALYKNGVISFSAGANPSRLRFLLPVGCLEKHHIDEVCQIIEETLKTID